MMNALLTTGRPTYAPFVSCILFFLSLLVKELQKSCMYVVTCM